MKAIDQGWPDFLVRGPLFKKKNTTAGRKNKNLAVFPHFKLKKTSIKVDLLQNYVHRHQQILLQGPQKIFGGPHAARGPQFGHVCNRPSRILLQKIIKCLGPTIIRPCSWVAHHFLDASIYKVWVVSACVIVAF
jgi:hypothetical protein